LLGGEAANAGIQCGVPGAGLDLFQDQQEVQGHPPRGEDKQATAHLLALPHKTVWGTGLMAWGWGLGGRI